MKSRLLFFLCSSLCHLYDIILSPIFPIPVIDFAISLFYIPPPLYGRPWHSVGASRGYALDSTFVFLILCV